MNSIVNNKICIKNLISELAIILKNDLPGINAQSKMVSSFQKRMVDYFNKDQILKPAAVLIVLFEEEDELKTFLIERVPDSGPHSGQIAFPGGRMENSDQDLIDTAIRETEEEIGIKIKKENILGHLTSVEIPVSGFSVLPVIGYTEFVHNPNRCLYEVNCILKVNLIELFKTKTSRIINVRGEDIEVPCYIVDNHIVWGATAMVLSEMEDIFEKLRF
ncbi:MAG: CoA pyrophosphatase [Bacteroidales bacterium]|nr:CoA pyrophosphatase [Bacteroidales bacterium]